MRERPAVFLDRDGVVNSLVLRKGVAASPRRWEDFHLLPGVVESVATLKRAGLLTIVVTNQPDIARGLLDTADLERMHINLRKSAGIDAIYACCHDDVEGCECRKPKPGLLLLAAEQWKISLKHSFLIGDSWKDIVAGQCATCLTLLVRSESPHYSGPSPDFAISSLREAAAIILSHIK